VSKKGRKRESVCEKQFPEPGPIGEKALPGIAKIAFGNQFVPVKA
jgi:hypothetical protein